jgi:molecular chaperone HtpG
MAICDADKDLLPSWARFIRAVIDCPALQPTASREAVHQDDHFEAVRRVLAEQLSGAMRKLATKQPEIWRQIVYAHSDVIIGWASKDLDFFRMVADAVPLRTSRGRIAMPEYLHASSRNIYYTTRELGSLQDMILAEGRDVPAIEAAWFGVQNFLERYAEIHPSVGLVRLDDDLDTLLRPVNEDGYHELLRLCEELGFSARPAAFRPSELPAAMTYSAGAEFVRETKSALGQGLIPDGFSALLRDYIHRHPSSSSNEGTLHLNTTCPLIQRLANDDLPIHRKQAAIATIAYFARLFCGRMLDAAQATADIGAWRRSLEKLI